MKDVEHQACLLLGSNIQPEQNLARGLDLLKARVQVLRISSVWESPAFGSPGPAFYNLAAYIVTHLTAEDLKWTVLRPLEAQLGRIRSADKYAPRPIDFDIILFDHQLLEPNLWRYAYIAVPVAEVLPGYYSERGDLLSERADQLLKTATICRREAVL